MTSWIFNEGQLARRLVVATVLFSSALTLVITAFQLYWQYRQDIGDLHQSATIIRDSWLESLTESVWDYDSTLIQMQLSGMVNLPFVEGVTLALSDGQFLNAGEHDKANSRLFKHSLYYLSGGQNRRLGELTIVADMALVYKGLWRFGLSMLLSNALKAALVVAFMLAVIQYLIGQHLLHISEYLNLQNSQQRRQPLQLKRTSRSQPDELDALVMAYNNLQQQVEQEHQRCIDESEKRAQLQLQLAQMDRQITMGEMATSLAHELNQPLASITGYADVCKRFIATDNTSKLETTLEKISGEAMRASEVIRRTREFVRSRSMTRERIALAELVEETAAIVTHSAQQFGIELLVHPAQSADRTIEGDRIQLQQVLVNLLRNAIDALAGYDQTSKLIQVNFTMKGSDYVAVIVEDNGPGIAPKVMDSLFSSFVTTKRDGMGVGLAISRNIVAAHGGTLHATNLSQGGAHFELILPCRTLLEKVRN